MILYHSEPQISTYNALSREVFVVNIFCEQPKLSIEEPNATRTIPATDLCLRLYAPAHVPIHRLPAQTLKQWRRWWNRNQTQARLCHQQCIAILGYCTQRN